MPLREDFAVVSINDHLVEPIGLWSRSVGASKGLPVPGLIEVDGREVWEIGGWHIDVAAMQLRQVLLPLVIGFAGERLRFLGTGAADPNELLSDQVVLSFIDDPHGVRHAEEVGTAQIVWQSDFPHWDGYWPERRSHLSRALSEMPDDQAEAIGGGNARRLLHLDP